MVIDLRLSASSRRIVLAIAWLCILTVCVQVAPSPGEPAGFIKSASAQSGDPSELMLDEPVGQLSDVDDARWSSHRTNNSLVALVWWVVMLFGLHLAGLPWVLMFFPRLGSRSTGLARLVAWLIASWLVWMLASLEIIAFRAVWCAVALAAVAITGWAWRMRRCPAVSPGQDIKNSIGSGPEIAFFVVFAFFLLLRFINPDSWHPAWGGEKPMEFAQINAILRTAHFPPYDPWFSDGILNYYYYGGYFVAFLMKLTGIPSEIAFNLAQPTVMALLASGVYAVTSALASRDAKARTATIGGFAGVMIVLFMGNLVSARNALRLLPDLPEASFVDWTWTPSRAISGAITEFPYFTGLYADLHAHVVALPMTVLVIAGSLELARRGDDADTWSYRETITTLAPLLLLMALALGALSATNAWDVPLYAALVAASIWMALEASSRSMTSLAVTAALSLATFLAGALFFLPFHRHYVALFSSVDQVRSPTLPEEWLLHVGGLLALCGIGVSGLAIRQGGHLTSVSLYRQLTLAIGGGITCAILAVYVARRLTVLPMHGIEALLVAIVAVLLSGWYIASRSRPETAVYLAGVVALVSLATIAWSGWGVLAGGAGIALLGAVMWFWPEQREIRFTGLLISAAGCAIAGLEVVFVVDDLAPDPLYYRMNSMFKIYNEIWILLAIAAAALTSKVIATALRDDLKPVNAEVAVGACSDDFCQDAHPGSRVRIEVPMTIAAAAIVALGLVYPVLATGPRLDQRFANHPPPRTLNALDWMDYGTLTSATGQRISFDGDRAAIDWFNAQVRGTPVIAEASIGPYRGNGSRISIATGLPTVIGWHRHELQQRYRPELDARLADVQRLYNAIAPEQVLEIIERYGIAFIIVGDVERFTVVDESSGRTFASSQGLETFEAMVGQYLEIAFQSSGTTVYRVVTN